MAPKVTKEYRDERRSELLKSALQCFSDNSYANTTIDDIVRLTGVSKGMFYTYFSSKEEVFLALVMERTERFLEQIESVFSAMPNAWDRLRYLLEVYREPLRYDQRQWISVFLEFFLSTSRNESRMDFMQRRYNRLIKLLENTVNEGKATGEFRHDVDSTAVSTLYWALCDGLHLHRSQLTQLEDNDEVYRTAIDMMHRFVTNAPMS
ncbi:TetR/AcrR family transcriptional regulator [Alicyclobacillus sp. SO9]|uniref:TetR/AcrR family transcriptional regulator n=1 Tax=Alicyclobacillus sp. SO9 TaxID=2665646 RepID=UPI0018E7278A|nr:TetR/AcrR family transcriptional regulator [Alicyclobacillus sp. SO9]QQE79765.1 TetR/AcrR family transcriptional regulator [Alicyclobacillus sp. SO9]